MRPLSGFLYYLVASFRQLLKIVFDFVRATPSSIDQISRYSLSQSFQSATISAGVFLLWSDLAQT
jgi:hypothetical protein